MDKNKMDQIEKLFRSFNGEQRVNVINHFYDLHKEIAANEAVRGITFTISAASVKAEPKRREASNKPIEASSVKRGRGRPRKAVEPSGDHSKRRGRPVGSLTKHADGTLTLVNTIIKAIGDNPEGVSRESLINSTKDIKTHSHDFKAQLGSYIHMLHAQGYITNKSRGIYLLTDKGKERYANCKSAPTVNTEAEVAEPVSTE